MIVIYHKNNQVTQIVSKSLDIISFNEKDSIAAVLICIATQFPNSRIFWCHEHYKENLNLSDCDSYFHNHKLMLSYNPSTANYLPNGIGYVEQSPFINVNKTVSYPTWQMSSVVGVLHASVLLKFNSLVSSTTNFDYFLNSVAKLALPKGLFCYSEPKLLKGVFKQEAVKGSKDELYRFVKQHYKLFWLLLLLMNEYLYERKIAIVPFIKALFYKRRKTIVNDLKDIVVTSSKKVIDTGTIDVIIPTIGRKKYLYDVLCDLAVQSYLPKNVIIVEQNPIKNSTSELDYLETKQWPFNIKHTFIHQAGACNARNIALSQVESEWVFFADDDIRFNHNLIKNAFVKINNFNIDVLITSCLKPLDNIKYINYAQTTIFGSGFSFVKAACLKSVAFDMAFEFGYGEDSDFGMQLRHKGYDIIYFPDLKITHLHAPMGGFRIKPTLAWDCEVIQPKPSPNIMLLKLKYDSKHQLKGYKTLLFFKLFLNGGLKKPNSFYKSFQQKWNVSLRWAHKKK